MSVSGKKVLVTGGSSGIGRETVKTFAAAGAASIAVIARRQDLLNETKKIVNNEFKDVGITLHSVDITNVEQVRTAAQKIGPWDIRVLNAGYMSTPARIEDDDLEEWWRGFEISINGQFMIAQAFMPSRNEGAKVIGTSTSAISMDASLQTSYSSYVTSKFGLVKFYEVLAAKYPDTHVVTFHPGIVETDMFVKSEMTGMPMDKATLPSHFAVWLVSLEAAFPRGKFVSTNWDVNELKVRAKEIQDSSILTSNILGWPFKP
ncbi:hypothetical protein LTR78_010885 [Recurvomyces mirabilis]|uniref:NAD(P)-binding protein n=1 Tax=Recurvomyces mirabilis TaxID=574656 RepID=A0AAE0WEW5_9PEZI|nr:hypothetical protein LTR78_010885 [Recurvomyces mirabilis]KAK5150043.1 hypothetical protein LTS14_010408 [Recurvomyces mirabilis]